jgi:hypothetical protein
MISQRISDQAWAIMPDLRLAARERAAREAKLESKNKNWKMERQEEERFLSSQTDLSQERDGKKKASACFVRNDGS